MFIVSALILVALVVGGAIFQDSIFIVIPPSSTGTDDGWAPWVVWLMPFYFAVVAALSSLESNRLRIDRAEFNSTGMLLTYSYVPNVFKPYEITKVRFDWQAVGRIVENHIDDGEGGHSYSIKVELTEPLKTGDTEFKLSMLDEKEMYQALRKIRVLQG